jgi:hypothetical protein
MPPQADFAFIIKIRDICGTAATQLQCRRSTESLSRRSGRNFHIRPVSSFRRYPKNLLTSPRYLRRLDLRLEQIDFIELWPKN